MHVMGFRRGIRDRATSAIVTAITWYINCSRQHVIYEFASTHNVLGEIMGVVWYVVVVVVVVAVVVFFIVVVGPSRCNIPSLASMRATAVALLGMSCRGWTACSGVPG